MGRQVALRGMRAQLDDQEITFQAERVAVGRHPGQHVGEIPMDELCRRPVFWAYCFLQVALASLLITILALAVDSANHCVWINGVCFDRPGGSYLREFLPL